MAQCPHCGRSFRAEKKIAVSPDLSQNVTSEEVERLECDLAALEAELPILPRQEDFKNGS